LVAKGTLDEVLDIINPIEVDWKRTVIFVFYLMLALIIATIAPLIEYGS